MRVDWVRGSIRSGVVGAVLLLTACDSSGGTPPGDAGASCHHDRDCAAGFECTDDRCVSSDAGPDAGGVDGGQRPDTCRN